MKINYNRLSDAELHQQLLLNGFPDVPVTETTRKVLLRKLENHNKRKSLESKQRASTAAHVSPVHFDGHQPTVTANSYYANNNNATYATDAARISSRPTIQNQHHNSGAYTPPKLNLPTLIHSSSEPSYSTYSPAEFSNQNGNPNMHYGIVNKLLSLRKRSATYPNGVGNDCLPQYKPNYLRTKLRRESIRSGSLLQRVSSSLHGQQTYVLQNSVPYVLLLALFAFMGLCSILYMAKSFDNWQINDANTNYTLCAAALTLPNRHVACVDNDLLPAGVLLSKELLKLLNQRAKGLNCAQHKQLVAITVEEFIAHLQQNQLLQNINVKHPLQIMPTIEHLIQHNPQWHMQLSYEPQHEMTSMATAASAEPTTHAVLYETALPFRCILNNKLHRFFFLVGILALVALAALVVFITHRLYQKWQNDRLVQVDNFTTSIVNELIQQASIANDFTQREVIINHLRDKLIPLKKRSSQMWSWNKALKLLEANDSRIQFGVSLHNGEEYRTIKWIENLSEASTRTSKLWQSSAFENTNKIVNPPTPCLKIRHMFDSSEVNNPNLKQVIENAIMEKVKSRCNILDIRLDTQTCCVYIRCASEEDAGIMHNEINGWWFDNRLVSIKFLRLQRFLSRFPK